MSSSDEDEDLRRAIALSLQCEADSTNSEKDQNTSIGEASSAIQHSISTRTQASGLQGLDRAAMERERLARAAKRRRSISPPPSKRAKLQESATSTEGSKNREQPLSGPKYPHGVVKKTWCFGFDRHNDIKIEEVLQKRDLKLAVLSSFQWDVDWLLSKLDVHTTKMVFVMQAKGELAQAQHQRDLEASNIPNLKLCFPDMSGQVNCMHSKLMLLVYPNYLRIAIPTANLVKFDWGETGVMENSIFIIDLPRLEKPCHHEQLTAFGKSLHEYVKAMGMPSFVTEGILNFNFTNTANMAFVHTIGGSHRRSAIRKTGFPGLCSAVQQLQLGSKLTELDFAASSIGSLHDGFLSQLFSAAQGVEFQRNEAVLGVREKIRIYFPSRETVETSKGGLAAGGTNCLQRKYYDSSRFPRQCFRDSISERRGLLSHNKLLFVRGQRGSENVAWVYLGSSNMSESAWGNVVTDRKTKEEKLNCRNWECGVLLPVPQEKLKQLPFQEGQLPPLKAAFGGFVDVPFEYPGDSLLNKTPWYFMEHA